MKLSEAQINQLAKLSQLKFSSGEKEVLKQKLDKMLSFMEKLQGVDTEGIPPLTHMASHYCPLREDKAKQKTNRRQALQNAPKTDGVYFLVPKMIQK